MAEVDELIQLARMADQRGDRDTAMKAMVRIEELQTSEPTQQQRRQRASETITQRTDDVEEMERMREAEIAELPEIGTHPMLSTLSGDALSREGLNLAIGFLSAPDEEFAQIIQSNLPESNVRMTELGNYIVDTPEGSYSLNKPGVSTRDVESLLFRAGVALPAGRTGQTGLKAIGQIAGQEAATEAGLQAAEMSAGGEFSPEQVALSAGLGGLSQGAGEAVSAVQRGIRGDIAEVPQSIIEAGEGAGVRVPTSDVVDQTRAGKLAAQTGEVIPYLGTGGMRRAQQGQREELATAISGSFPPVSPDEVFESLKRQTDKVKKAAGTARGDIINKTADIQSDLSNAIPAIDKEIDRLTNLPNGEPRKVVDTDTVSKLQAYKADLVADPTMRGVEQLRTNFREGVKGDDATKVLQGRSQAAVDNIYSAMTKDLDAIIKDNLTSNEFRQWKNSNRVYAQEASKIKKSRLKNILNTGDIVPEKATAMLFSKKPSEVNTLYKSLDTKGRQAGRASIIADATKKAMDENGQINVNRFAGELKKNKTATDIFFKGKDKKVLEGYKRLLNATRRGQDFNVTTPTGQQMLGAGGLVGTGAGMIDPAFMSTVGSAGAAARIYESEVMRDFLLKLSNTKAGSIESDRLIREYMPAVNAIVVSQEEVTNVAEEATE